VEELAGFRAAMVEEHMFHLAGWPMESGRDEGVPQIPVFVATTPGESGQQPRTTELQTVLIKGKTQG
jgi:hypothetical protein